MLLFFAGSAAVEKEFPLLQEQVDQRLLSYHYMSPSLDKFYFNDENIKKYSNIIMDSGAFSAWNNGAVIDIDKYVDYCLKYINYITYVVNLDVIPASPGIKNISDEERERSAAEGYKNYEYLLKRGIPKEKIIHVFHQNEEFHWLERMVDDMDYIGLSPANDRSTAEKIVWLDKCMQYVTDSDGHAKVKFHGFAVTSFRLMKLYPWFSVDSSTWATVAGRGVTFIPKKIRNSDPVRWNYWDDPQKCSLSQVQNKKDHFFNKTGLIRQNIQEYLEYLNIPMGDIAFKIVPNDYTLQDNERPCSEKYLKNLGVKTGDDELGFLQRGDIHSLNLPNEQSEYKTTKDLILPYQHKLVEIVKQRGIQNDWRWRQYLNALFLKSFSKLKKEPAKFIDRKDPANNKNGFNIQ